MAIKPNPADGVFVNVVDLLDMCTRALAKAEHHNDHRLQAAAQSVMSALMLHVGKRHATLPEEVRPFYNKVIKS